MKQVGGVRRWWLVGAFAASTLVALTVPAGASRDVDRVGGYVYRDSTEPGGPNFAPLSPATLSTVSGTDEGEQTVNLPFSFSFYDVTYQQVTIGANGALEFPGGKDVARGNAPLDTAANRMIAPWWDDWVPNSVYYGTFGSAPNRIFVVAWRFVRHKLGISPSDMVDFQVQLHEKGDAIEFHYEDTVAGAYGGGASGTVGIDNASTSALQYSHDTSSLSNGLAIRFEPLLCAGRRPTIVGTFGSDMLSGTPGADVIVGLAGGDGISSGAGNDVVCGGDGSDNIALARGADRGIGGGGNDQIRGGDDNDELFGARGQDDLSGGPGSNDRCNGGPGADTATPSCEIRISVP